jgi:hypothetical protein
MQQEQAAGRWNDTTTHTHKYTTIAADDADRHVMIKKPVITMF